MLTLADNRFGPTTSPHSIANRLAMSIPMPGWDSNPLVKNMKEHMEQGLQGSNYGLRGLTFDGTGLLGTGLFAGDISTWGVPEMLGGVIGAYALYSMVYQTKQTKYRMEASVGRRRKSTAVKLRVKAKRLEEQTEGIF